MGGCCWGGMGLPPNESKLRRSGAAEAEEEDLEG